MEAHKNYDLHGSNSQHGFDMELLFFLVFVFTICVSSFFCFLLSSFFAIKLYLLDSKYRSWCRPDDLESSYAKNGTVVTYSAYL